MRASGFLGIRRIALRMFTASSSDVTSQPGGELKLSFLETVEGQSDLTVSLLEAEEGLGLQEKRLVICVAIDDGEPLFSLGLPEATAELLHPKKARFGRPHHHDRGNVRKVPAS
jgi:hypothetical protein